MDFFTLFADPDSWQVFASGQAEGKLSRVIAADGSSGVRLDYDFHGGHGFVAMRLGIALRLPHTFDIGFQLRGEGLPNHLEFKVVSPGGANVWRHLHNDYQLPAEWTYYCFNEREIPFAWGPAGGGAPSEVDALEIVIAAGSGGKGSVEFSNAFMEDQTLRSPHAISASSFLTNYSPDALWIEGSGGWRAIPEDKSPWWAIDFGRRLRFGGLVIHWPDDLPPRSCAVEVSNNGKIWTKLHCMARAYGSMSHISAPGGEARHLRVVFDDASYAAMCRVEMKPDAFSSTPNEFMHSVAVDYPRGFHPRYWHREQSYWTTVGSPEGKRRALMNEEGLIEVDEAGFSLEPFILTNEGVISWADVQITCDMAKHGIPMPSVSWKKSSLRLEILPWVEGTGDDLTLCVTYQLKATKPHEGLRLALAIRPFQVNPPWQAFRNLGGCSPITAIACGSDSIRVNDRMVYATPAPFSKGAAIFDEGGVLEFLSRGRIPAAQQVEDSTGLASAALMWELSAGENLLETTISVPFFGSRKTFAPSSRSKALAQWNEKLGYVKWQVPDCARTSFDCLRTAAGHILINRDGAAIQPGPRRYTRSWIRDSVIMGAAMTKVGLPHVLDEFIRWYASFQRADGFVPCVVDRDGVDWLVEHDSHGQFLWGIREVFRAGQDKDFLTKIMPHAQKAVDFMIELRAERMTADFLEGDFTTGFGLLPESVSLDDEDMLDPRSEFYGLMKESASHEGYLAHPVHSYWDDFWGVRGLQAAADLAEALDDKEKMTQWRKEACRFQDDLLWSLNKVISKKNLNYIPGSIEWADFDPTATANAIALLDFADVLPADAMHATLDAYLVEHQGRHGGGVPWKNYSAYEIRLIGAFVRVENREVAQELLDFFLSDRRPCGWNQWPEITWFNSRSPGHLGDVPHTWVAAEYILSLISMVADEREASCSLVLAAGMSWKWISEGEGFSVSKLPTRYGLLEFHIRASGEDLIHIEIADTIAMPPGGLWVIPPLPKGRRMGQVVMKSGRGAIFGHELHIHQLPCVTEIHLFREQIT
jgi:hypothetical protein